MVIMSIPRIRIPPEAPPPPIPARSPLRDSPAYQRKNIYDLRTRFTAVSTSISSSASFGMLEEIDRMLEDTRQRIIETESKDNSFENDSLPESLRGREPDIQKRRRSNMSANGEGTALEFLISEPGSEARSVATCSTEPLLSKRATCTQQHMDESPHTTMSEDVRAIYRPVGLPNDSSVATSNVETSIPSFDYDRRNFSQDEVEDEAEHRVQAWLTRGLSSPVSQASEHARYPDTHRNQSYSSRQPSLSIFPPPSATTRKREYSYPSTPLDQAPCPSSLLKNGHDTHGNHNLSDQNNCLIVQSLPPPLALELLLEHPDEQSQQTPVHQGGGWSMPKLCWTRTSTEEQDTGQGPTIGDTRYTKIAKEPISVPINQANCERFTADRVPQNSRSYLSVDYYSDSHLLQSPQASAPQANASYKNPTSELHNQSRSQCVPMSGGMRPLTMQNTVYGLEHVRIRRGPISLPINMANAPVGEVSALQPHSYPVYRSAAFQASGEERPRLPNYPEVARDVQRDEDFGRTNQKWDKVSRYETAKLRSAVPQKDADLLGILKNNNGDDTPVFSARTADDELRSLEGLHDSGPYMKIAQARAARRIQEKREHKQQEDLAERRNRHEERRRDSDVSTITPNDSKSQMGQRRQTKSPSRLEMHSENEQDDYHSFDFGADPPQHRPMRQSRQQNLHSSLAHTMLHLPSTAPAVHATNERKSVNSMQMAFRVAGKVLRFLPAIPPDPNVKTLSNRHPPTDNSQRRVLKRVPPRNDGHQVPARSAHGSLDMPSSAAPLAKDKGRATTNRSEYATRVPNQTDLAGTTVFNSNPITGRNTLKVPNPRFQFDSMSASDAGTAFTRWPQEDSAHNVVVSRKSLGMRGSEGEVEVQSGFSTASSASGEANKSGKWKEKMKSKWGNSEYCVGTHALTMQTIM